MLSASGLACALFQYFLYDFMVSWVGLLGSIRVGAALSTPSTALVPLVLFLNHGRVGDDALTWQSFVFLSAILAIYRVFCIAFYTSLAVSTNNTVPTSLRATANGVFMVIASFAQGIGPTLTGLLVSFSFSSTVMSPHVGAFVVWWTIGLVGIGVFVGSLVALTDTQKHENTRDLDPT